MNTTSLFIGVPPAAALAPTRRAARRSDEAPRRYGRLPLPVQPRALPSESTMIILALLSAVDDHDAHMTCAYGVCPGKREVNITNHRPSGSRGRSYVNWAGAGVTPLTSSG